MIETGGRKTRVASTPKDIEDQLELTIADLRREIERTLEERIQELKRDAQRKIEQSAEEVAEGKTQLRHYQSILAELEKESAEVRERIRRHVENAGRTKAEVLKLVDLQNAELTSIRDHIDKLARFREEAALRAKVLRGQLEAKFGLAAKLPEITAFTDGAGGDARQELERWTKVKELLGPAETIRPSETKDPLETLPATPSRGQAPSEAGLDYKLISDEMRPIFEEDLETIFTDP